MPAHGTTGATCRAFPGSPQHAASMPLRSRARATKRIRSRRGRWPTLTPPTRHWGRATPAASMSTSSAPAATSVRGAASRLRSALGSHACGRRHGARATSMSRPKISARSRAYARRRPLGCLIVRGDWHPSWVSRRQRHCSNSRRHCRPIEGDAQGRSGHQSGGGGDVQRWFELGFYACVRMATARLADRRSVEWFDDPEIKRNPRGRGRHDPRFFAATMRSSALRP
jgi:hypothetical protein